MFIPHDTLQPRERLNSLFLKGTHSSESLMSYLHTCESFHTGISEGTLTFLLSNMSELIRGRGLGETSYSKTKKNGHSAFSKPGSRFFLKIWFCFPFKKQIQRSVLASIQTSVFIFFFRYQVSFLVQTSVFCSNSASGSLFKHWHFIFCSNLVSAIFTLKTRC